MLADLIPLWLHITFSRICYFSGIYVVPRPSLRESNDDVPVYIVKYTVINVGID